ncbi:hypothetical protein [Micromonospora globbae]|uniref:hypothetical protein n=1 Tax=Micromonospora globbae TaxID=1894969 RepID=UPI00386F064B|nr:hypothetical protein OH732_25895 [Micromonospora globbae]
MPDPITEQRWERLEALVFGPLAGYMGPDPADELHEAAKTCGLVTHLLDPAEIYLQLLGAVPEGLNLSRAEIHEIIATGLREGERERAEDKQRSGPQGVIVVDLAQPEKAQTTPSVASPANEEPAGVPEADPRVPAPVRTEAEAIWSARPILRAIRAIATERMVGPWAVLGGVLAQVACRIGPHVQLPPIVGGYASLNVFIGLVGPSGAGKDAATAVAAELLGVEGRIPTRKLGSSQGIDASFTAQHPKLGAVQYNDVALFTVPEIDSLAAHASMNGSPLMATLREVYTGSALGAHYAAKDKRRPVGAHRYRAAVLAGIQPARASILLDDADGGTPQRWVWLPTDDPGPKHLIRLQPPARERWFIDYEVWQPNGENPEDEPIEPRERIVVQVCGSAVQAIRAAREKRLNMSFTEQGSDLEGHALLTRLKVATLLGFLDARCEASEEDWALAGRIMAMSNHARVECQQVIADRAKRQQQSRGQAEAERVVAAEERKEDLLTQQAARAILTRLTNKGGELVRSELRGNIKSHLKPAFDSAVELLVATGQLRMEERPSSTTKPATWYVLIRKPS